MQTTQTTQSKTSSMAGLVGGGGCGVGVGLGGGFSLNPTRAELLDVSRTRYKFR